MERTGCRVCERNIRQAQDGILRPKEIHGPRLASGWLRRGSLRGVRKVCTSSGSVEYFGGPRGLRNSQRSRTEDQASLSGS